MKHIQVNFIHEFDVLAGNQRSQAAVMTLPVGESTGGPDNRHENSDQWLFVVQGLGTAVIAGEEIDLMAGSLLFIEQGESHEIRNTGDTPLETINFYAPPAY